MSVMVDELRVWPNATGIFRKGSCHLTASTVDELHEFAALIGMRREWFQDHRVAPHYDLTPKRRAAAIAAGAVAISMRVQLLAKRIKALPIEASDE